MADQREPAPRPARTREIRLVRRPVQEPTHADFALVHTDLPAPHEGGVLVRNTLLSVDPYMRIRMHGSGGYMPPFALDVALDGAALGVVEESRCPALPRGATVTHGLGWREHVVGDPEAFRMVDVDAAPPEAYLGPLGLAGWTAYVGLFDIAALAAGDTVFVSAAAGAVGSLAGQMARLGGASRVIGSAGSPEKVRWLVEEAGFDAAFDYHDGPLADRLAEHAPEGLDVYFDNVGGDHLEASLDAMRPFGRIAVCGAISQYNADVPLAGASNLFQLVAKDLSMRGFLVGHHPRLAAEFAQRTATWLRDGHLAVRYTIVDGLERMPEAFIGLLRGDNLGKMLVRV
jgi:NADPH-dependent curcumin reductase CurA